MFAKISSFLLINLFNITVLYADTSLLQGIVGSDAVPSAEDLIEHGNADSYIILEKKQNGSELMVAIFLTGGSPFNSEPFSEGRVEGLKMKDGTVVQHKALKIDSHDLSNLQYILERNEIPFLVEAKQKSWVLARSRTSYVVTISNNSETRTVRRELGESLPMDTFVQFVEWLSML